MNYWKRSKVNLKVLCIVSIWLLGFSEGARGQQNKISNKLRFFRWQEDYSDLSTQYDSLNRIEKMKLIPLSKSRNSYLSLGGQYRMRMEAFQKPLYSIPPFDNFTSFNHRFLLHADLHFGQSVRFFTEFGFFRENGREPAVRDVDEGNLDLTQGFIDIKLSPTNELQALLRLGRQEIPLGSSRLFGIREGPNIRRSFDAVKLNLTADGGYSVQVMAGKPVNPKRGSFDDSWDEQETFWAIYAGIPFFGLQSINPEVFYIGRSSEDQLYQQGVADETRHTVGSRIHGRKNSWDFNYEWAYQFGSFGDFSISAWGISTTTGYRFKSLPGTPRLAVSANIASGDKDPNEGDLQTFHALYPNLAFFSQAATYSPSNAIDVHPSIEVNIIKSLSINLGSDFIWRLSNDDALYTPVYIPLIAASDSNERFATALVQVGATWRPIKNIELMTTYVRGTASPLIEEQGGEAFDFLVLNTSLKF